MTEKKTVSKVASTVSTKSEADFKPTRQPPVRRTTVSKTPVKRVVSNVVPKTAAIIKKTEPIKTTIVKQSKPEDKTKPSKMKMARDSFTMPKEEYGQLGLLKTRLAELGQPVKKSELLRAGVKLLVAMTDARLKATMAAIPVIKTGRPKKKK